MGPERAQNERGMWRLQAKDTAGSGAAAIPTLLQHLCARYRALHTAFLGLSLISKEMNAIQPKFQPQPWLCVPPVGPSMLDSF